MFHLGKHADRFSEAEIKLAQAGAKLLFLQLDLLFKERFHDQAAGPCLLKSLDAVDRLGQ